MPYFFTLLDESLRPRGSRDPLGAELIWSGAGRELVGNLTTVTAHLDNFVFALLGLHLASDDRSAPEWRHFQRFEQVTGHVRVRLGKPDGVLGRRRIQERVSTDSIDLGPRAKILENQRQAGMWGLYSSALTVTGLIKEDRSLTAAGRRLAEQFVAKGTDLTWLSRLWTAQSIAGNDLEAITHFVRQMLSSHKARRELANQLLTGGEKAPLWQKEVYDQARRFLQSTPAGAGAKQFLIHLKNHSSVVGEFASRVEKLDNALILADVIFSMLLGKHGVGEEKIFQAMEGLLDWPQRTEMRVPHFPEVRNKELHTRLGRLREFVMAFAAGDLAKATGLLLNHHEKVAIQRGGVAWCFWENGKLKVVTSEHAKPLPGKQDLEQRFGDWAAKRTNGFFLTSFLAVLAQSDITKQIAAQTNPEAVT